MWAGCPRSRTAAPCCGSAPATPAASRSPTCARHSPSRVLSRLFYSSIMFHCNTNLLEPHPKCRRQRQDELERAWWEQEASLLTKSSSGAATPAVPAPGEGAGAAAAAEPEAVASRQVDTLDWAYFVTECLGECGGAGAAAPCPVGSWGPFTACPAPGWLGQVACVCRWAGRLMIDRHCMRAGMLEPSTPQTSSLPRSEKRCCVLWLHVLVKNCWLKSAPLIIR